MSAVFILMITHRLIMMYNNMPDESNSFEEQKKTSNETNAGNSMGKLCLFF